MIQTEQLKRRTFAGHVPSVDKDIFQVRYQRNIFVIVRKFVIQSLTHGTRHILVEKFVGRLWRVAITNVFCFVILDLVQPVLKLYLLNVTVARANQVSRDVTTPSGPAVDRVAGNGTAKYTCARTRVIPETVHHAPRLVYSLVFVAR